MAPAAVQKMKVAELRAELKRRGLDASGLKAALVARLKEAMEAEDGADAGGGGGGDAQDAGVQDAPPEPAAQAEAAASEEPVAPSAPAPVTDPPPAIATATGPDAPGAPASAALDAPDALAAAPAPAKAAAPAAKPPVTGKRLSKNEKLKLRRAAKKAAKRGAAAPAAQNGGAVAARAAPLTVAPSVGSAPSDEGVDYVAVLPEVPVESATDEQQRAAFEELRKAMGRFGGADPDAEAAAAAAEAEAAEAAAAAVGGASAGVQGDEAAEGGSDSDSDSDAEDAKGTKGDGMSNKQRKMAARLKIADLKAKCRRPEVVEAWDVTAPDPRTLVYLKSYRNVVPVPTHWSARRKYLQGKRGIEKPPFELPDFIKATGIDKIRQAYGDKEAEKGLKAKTRDRRAPKMGAMDIDYAVLHDAFFKYQTKPPLETFGDVYFEGKEFDAQLTNKRPGQLSAELMAALGMAEGAPPPWLINMQRHGMPPSYPLLKIPGLSAPLPPGAQYGYHAGGWGKPPVDERGTPLYGDVFGTVAAEAAARATEEPVDKTSRWGDLRIDSDSESESESEDDSDEEKEEDDAGGLTEDQIAAGTASGIASSVAAGLETPDVLDLRKKAAPQQLYTVLEQREASVGGAMMGSSHTYVVPGKDGAPAGGAAAGGGLSAGAAAARVAQGVMGAAAAMGDIEVNLRPEDLEGLDQAGIERLYAQRQAELRGGREDFSDLVRENAKRKREGDDKAAKAKKKKAADDFKF